MGSCTCHYLNWAGQRWMYMYSVFVLSFISCIHRCELRICNRRHYMLRSCWKNNQVNLFPLQPPPPPLTFWVCKMGIVYRARVCNCTLWIRSYAKCTQTPHTLTLKCYMPSCVCIEYLHFECSSLFCSWCCSYWFFSIVIFRQWTYSYAYLQLLWD